MHDAPAEDRPHDDEQCRHGEDQCVLDFRPDSDVRGRDERADENNRGLHRPVKDGDEPIVEFGLGAGGKTQEEARKKPVGNPRQQIETNDDDDCLKGGPSR